MATLREHLVTLAKGVDMEASASLYWNRERAHELRETAPLLRKAAHLCPVYLTPETVETLVRDGEARAYDRRRE